MEEKQLFESRNKSMESTLDLDPTIQIKNYNFFCRLRNRKKARWRFSSADRRSSEKFWSSNATNMTLNTEKKTFKKKKFTTPPILFRKFRQKNFLRHQYFFNFKKKKYFMVPPSIFFKISTFWDLNQTTFPLKKTEK